jgi:hypothetical protein
MRRSLWKGFFLVWAAVCFSADKPPTIVTAHALLASDAVHPGSTVQAAVVAEVAPGYHINDHKPTLEYLIPSELKLESSPEVAVEDVIYPQGKLEKFAFEDKSLSVYEGKLVVKAVLKVARTARPGDYRLKGKFAYQACNDHACLPPTSVPVELSVKVVRAGAAVKRANEDSFQSAKPQ